MFNIAWSEIAEIAIKMGLALLCGGALGLERERKRRPAGFRTYILVCLGATVVMMTNQFICDTYGSGDYARMGAQVISGIGFLGAGTIITTGYNRVKGLTTAAGLWAAACIGLAIGIGYYAGAILGMLAILLTMVVLHSLDSHLMKAGRIVVFYVELKKMSVVRRVTAFVKENNMDVLGVEVGSPESGKLGRVVAIITLKLCKKTSHAEIQKMIEELEGVIYVENI